MLFWSLMQCRHMLRTRTTEIESDRGLSRTVFRKQNMCDAAFVIQMNTYNIAISQIHFCIYEFWVRLFLLIIIIIINLARIWMLKILYTMIIIYGMPYAMFYDSQELWLYFGTVCWYVVCMCVYVCLCVVWWCYMREKILHLDATTISCKWIHSRPGIFS